ncbi:MAG: hypothetical protein LBQ88_15245 [Treponema sp.]|jgi:hypothetical protein|nr:hypothetical protein [Treponema sp.]
MRKLVLILIAFIAVVTFIRAYDHIGTLQKAEMGNAPEIMVNIDSK